MKKTKKSLIAAGIAAMLATPVTSVFAETSGEQTFSTKGSIQLTYQVVETPQEITVPVQISHVNTGVHADKVLSNGSIFLTGTALLILMITYQEARQEEDSD